MFATLDGLQLAFTEEGQGTPLVFLHGFPLSRAAWGAQVDAFRADRRVLAPDLRGFGESDSTPGSVSMHTFAEDLHDLLRHLGAGPVVLAGHSMGGYVALAFARAYPEALRGLVLVGTRAGADSPEAGASRLALAAKVGQEGPSGVVASMAAKMLAPGNGDAASAAAVRGFIGPGRSEGLIGALLGMAARPDATPWLGALKVPVLVLAGAEDAIIPAADAKALAGLIPGAQLQLIPDAGHLVAFEQPAAFNQALRLWMGRTGL